MKKFQKLCLIAGVTVLTCGYGNVVNAEAITTIMQLIDEEGVQEEIGTITIEDTEYGVLLTPNLSDLPPGIHGFHLHENPSCEPGVDDGEVKAGLAAGGHYDPKETESHEGPYGEGHLGDLPPLIVDRDGVASLPILVPRLYPKDFQGRAVMVHAEGDNFADEPKSLGGGGGRIACGVVEGN